MKFAHTVEEKGPNEYAIEQVKEDIESMGIRRMIIKTDQESAIVALRERIIDALGTRVEDSRLYRRRVRWTTIKEMAKLKTPSRSSKSRSVF